MPDPQASDKALMLAVQHNDSSALVMLIERWELRLLNFIFRYVQNESISRDLVQETFVRIYQNRQRYDPNKPFSTWMFSIAVNLCRNHQRWLKRHAEAPLDVIHEPIDRSLGGIQPESSEQQKIIANAVASLPHGMRTAVIFFYYEDFSYQEIAAITGCSVRGIESRLYRAKKILAEKLLNQDGISPAALTRNCGTGLHAHGPAT